jgi:hypothetical protein
VLVEVVVARQAPHTLPVPAIEPPRAAHRASSRATRARKDTSAGMQQSTADGLPQVECAAQVTRPRVASLRQPPLRSALRKRTTQRTYWPWVSAASQGQVVESAAATSSGHGIGPGLPRRAIASAGNASRTARARRRLARIVGPRGVSIGRSSCEPCARAAGAAAPCAGAANRVTLRRGRAAHRPPRRMLQDERLYSARKPSPGLRGHTT